MKAEVLLEKLEDTARRLSIKVDYEDLQKGEVRTRGGLFRLKGEDRILIHKKLSTKERAEVLLGILSRVDTEGVHIPEAIRKKLDAISSPEPQPF